MLKQMNIQGKDMKQGQWRRLNPFQKVQLKMTLSPEI